MSAVPKPELNNSKSNRDYKNPSCLVENTMTGKCIYCGQAPTTRRGDHVPPQKFFSEPRGHPLIQVPCCNSCNEAFSRDDERMRNLLSCIENTQAHPLHEELRGKRNRSIERQASRSNLKHLLENSSYKPRFSDEGAYLGQALALDFNHDVVKRFFERMAKALHHYTYNTGFVRSEVVSSNIIEDDLQNFFETYAPSSYATLGDDIFFYADFSADPTRFSLWFMRFYGGAEFWAKLTLLPEEAE